MGDRIKYYFDEHVSKAVSEGLRRRGVDVLRAQEAGLLSASDQAHIEFASKEGRVLFTQDADFLRLHGAGYNHAGIVYAAQPTPVGHTVRSLMLIYDVLNPEDMVNHIEFL